LSENVVWDSLNNWRNAWQTRAESQAVCRCSKRCASGMDVEFILRSREWYYTWHTHDEAVAELGKVMANNMRSVGSYYIVGGKKVQLTSALYINHP
jgi:hypothetical protein